MCGPGRVDAPRHPGTGRQFAVVSKGAPVRRWIGWGAICAILALSSLHTQGELGIQAWVQRYNGLANGNDAGYAVTVDRSNNVCVTGYTTNSTSGLDFVTIKYSAFGQSLWTNWYNG